MTDMTELTLEYRVREETEVRDRPAPRAETREPEVVTLEAAEAPELDGLVPADEELRTAAGTPAETERPAARRIDEPRSPDLISTYFRQMGRAELMTREQEVALAQRIEAAQDALVAGLAGVPMLVARIDGWGRELREEQLRLRDLVEISTSDGAPAPAAQPAAQPAAATDDDNETESDGSAFGDREQALLPGALKRVAALGRVAAEIAVITKRRMSQLARGRDISKANRVKLHGLLAKFGAEVA